MLQSTMSLICKREPWLRRSRLPIEQGPKVPFHFEQQRGRCEGMGSRAIILVEAHQKTIVNCFGFAADNKEAISKLKTGQKISVKGKCMGKVATDSPALEDSVLQ